jgi:AcrR family transcriptional regulator
MQSAAPLRRTQEERSAETRERLLDATLACLIEEGYAHTTTTRVCERAGLSRGAQVHHFRRKSDLVISAVAHLAARQAHELRKRAESLPEDGDRVERLIDSIVELFAEPIFYAALELWTAARTDPELLESVLEFERPAGRHLADVWRELAGPLADAPQFEAAMELTIHLARGMGLQKILRPDDANRKRQLVVWKQTVTRMLREGV